jgi:hypothetical protein
MSQKDSRISEDSARELWKRALELQAAAEGDRPEPQALIPGEAHGLSLDQVAAAAEGAGIDPDYVRMALAERRLPDADRIDPNLWTARWLKRILHEPDAIELTHSIAASPAQVVAALKTVSMRPEFELIYEGLLGSDATRDGVLVYRLPNAKMSFHNDLDWTDVRVLVFAIRPNAANTTLRLRIPLFRRGINLTLLGGSAGLMGFGGLTAGSGLASALAGLVGAASVVAMVPIATGAAGVLLGIGAYRAAYRWGVRGGRSSAQRLLRAVAAEAESLQLAE